MPSRNWTMSGANRSLMHGDRAQEGTAPLSGKADFCQIFRRGSKRLENSLLGSSYKICANSMVRNMSM